MPGIYDEIQQRKPFEDPGREAVVTLLRTAEVLRHALDRALVPHGISPEQYNVLRILRGARGTGHATLAIAERMISRSPNITRLVDKLIAKGLVRRDREASDRRLAIVLITPEGLTMLRRLDRDVDRVLGGTKCLDPTELRSLISMLDTLRDTLAVETVKEASRRHHPERERARADRSARSSRK